jgi:hypothetical protein
MGDIYLEEDLNEMFENEEIDALTHGVMLGYLEG